MRHSALAALGVLNNANFEFFCQFNWFPNITIVVLGFKSGCKNYCVSSSNLVIADILSRIVYCEVIAAHCASEGESKDLDNGGVLVNSYDLLKRLFDDPKYDDLLYLLQPLKLNTHLRFGAFRIFSAPNLRCGSIICSRFAFHAFTPYSRSFSVAPFF